VDDAARDSAAPGGRAPGGAPSEELVPMAVTAADMDDALRELQDTRNAMTRVLLGGADAG
jgi:hypothetical protein